MTASAKIAADWIAVDWGTTRLRAWAMVGDGVVARAQSDDGMAGRAPDAFEPALLALVGGWLEPARRTTVVACGMVGSRQGWIEAPYRAAPCTPLGAPFVAAPARDPRLLVRIAPGLRQADPADVMRGEETQIAGLLARSPGWAGAVCLPGTHSKWVEVAGGAARRFRTFMTGELFDLLSRRSVLRHSVEGWEAGGFDEGLDEGFARPEALTARLFAIRAEGLLDGLDPGRARARLSGLLIGAELSAARPFWRDRRVAVIGEGALARLYAAALERLGAPAEDHDAAQATLAGLGCARALAEGESACDR